MPLGKHKGWPLADVARDAAYYALFKGTAYAQMTGKTGPVSKTKTARLDQVVDFLKSRLGIECFLRGFRQVFDGIIHSCDSARVQGSPIPMKPNVEAKALALPAL